MQSFYHSNFTEPGVLSMESFERLGYTRIQPSGPELLERLLQPNYRADVLMYLISWCIVQRVDFHGSRWNTLLPPECVESMKAMAGSASSGEIFYHHTNYLKYFALLTRFLASLNNWRTSTAQLLQKTYVEHGFTRDDPRTSHIEAALKALMPILKPFVDEGKATAAFEDLEDILEAAARFGFKLFASPNLYEFDWRESRWFESGELTPLPELRKVDDEFGSGGLSLTF